jgi:titin
MVLGLFRGAPGGRSRGSQSLSHRKLIHARRRGTKGTSHRPPWLEVLEDRWLLSVFTVTNVNDSGSGSLRQAILDANAEPDGNTIQFAIDSGAQIIALSSALPAVTKPVILDGTTQPGYAGTPLIELDGINVPTYGAGLTINAGSSTVKGLVISNFRGSGLALNTNGNNVIQGNFIGTDLTGTLSQANGGEGIVVSSSGNQIGGRDPGAGNVISGNRLRGINLAGTGNVVQGNLIGTDVTGTNPLGNAGGGFFVGAGGNQIGGTDPGAGNVISGNGSIGITIGSAGNQVQGNLIGTDASGTVGLGNAGDGVEINAGESNHDNLIGGNVISGNATGVAIFGANNIVQGNLIGTDVTGSVAIHNVFSGVDIGSGAGADNLIGGTDPGTGNVISGNGTGITLRFGSGMGNVVEGNFIGTDSAGDAALGNAGPGVDIEGAGLLVAGNFISGNVGDGVLIRQGATGAVVQGNLIGTDVTGTMAVGNGGNGVQIQGSNNTIGGTYAGAANLIAFNGRDGVEVDTGIGNAIQENSIFANGNLGIELINHGNQDQAAPVLDSASSDGSSTTVVGTLTSTPDTTFTLEFFANTDAGAGEGEQFLGFVTVTTDDSGQARFTATLGVGIDVGQYVTATATDPTGNTSAFSTPVVVSEATSPAGAGSQGTLAPATVAGAAIDRSSNLGQPVQPDATSKPASEFTVQAVSDAAFVEWQDAMASVFAPNHTGP